MNKYISTSLLPILSIILLFTSCIGDQGNVVESYDIGSVIEYKGQPVIKTDNIGIYITGAGITVPTDKTIKRCLSTFTIDWDAQSEEAYANRVYSANIAIQENWTASNYEEIANKPFAGSDSLNSISEPYLTVLGDTTMITFETSFDKSENSTIQFVVESIDKVAKVLIIDYIYYTGDAPTVTTTESKWQSYILPKVDDTYSLVLRFKNKSALSFDTETYESPDGDKNKNCYLYTLSYKSTDMDK